MRRVAITIAVLLATAGAVGCGPAPAPLPDAPAAPPASLAPTVVPVVVDPLVPGWSPVRSVKRAAVYDVPPSWEVSTESTIIGFESKAGERVGASAAAEFGRGACGSANSTLALSGVKHDTGSDLLAAARGTARQWADLAYRDDQDRRPTLSAGRPEAIRTIAGQPAVMVKVDARTASRAGACKLTHGRVYAIAATGYQGELGPTVILVLVADADLPKAITEPEIRQILTTLRPA